jgi:hypothetical protein
MIYFTKTIIQLKCKTNGSEKAINFNNPAVKLIHANAITGAVKVELQNFS